MQVSENPPEGIDWRIKEAIMHLIGSLSELIVSQNDMRELMEPMMAHHITMELSSMEALLRWRSVWLYGEFQCLNFVDQNHIHAVVDAIYKNLYDNELPVKMIAATTIYKLLKNNEVAQSFLRPALKDIFGVYLKLLTDVDSDDLVKALERLVTFYKEDVEPYATQLSTQLVDSY